MENTILQQETKETHHTFCSRMIVIAEIILCILLLPTFIICAMMFISSLLHPNLPPSFMGYTPLVVESGSMSPFFLQNDLILIRNGKEDTIYEKGTVICFQSEDVYVTHRITKVDDIIITLPQIMPQGVTMHLNGRTASVSEDGKIYTFENVGILEAGKKKNDSYTLTFTADSNLVEGDFQLKGIKIDVHTEQID